MRIELKVDERHKELQADLLGMVSKVTKASQAILISEANIIMSNSLQIVPEDTGALMRSAYINTNPFNLPYSAAAWFGYGSPSLNEETGLMANEYMIAVHEDTSVIHENGQAKFLEKPVLDRQADYRLNLADGLSKVFIRQHTIYEPTKNQSFANKFKSEIGGKARKSTKKIERSLHEKGTELNFLKKRIKELEREEFDAMEAMDHVRKVNPGYTQGVDRVRDEINIANYLVRKKGMAYVDPAYTAKIHRRWVAIQNAPTREQKTKLMDSLRTRIEDMHDGHDSPRMRQWAHAEKRIKELTNEISETSGRYGGKSWTAKAEARLARQEEAIHKDMVSRNEGWVANRKNTIKKVRDKKTKNRKNPYEPMTDGKWIPF